MGLFFIIGTFWLIYEIGYDKLQFKEYKIIKEYTALAFCLVMGCLFCYKGKIRTVVFDHEKGTLTIKKANSCCDKRSVVQYQLEDIMDARAVFRDYKNGGTVHMRAYVIVLKFESSTNANSNHFDSGKYEDVSSSSGSDDQLNVQK